MHRVPNGGSGLSRTDALAGRAAGLLLSRHTVHTHVSHILVKLDVHSRVDIARELALHRAAQRPV
jgi:ATP/maltotriose-dependent transcriptional regulator MalT